MTTTSALNIDALRKTQQSIADETVPFAMGDWCTCIAAHAVRAATGRLPTYTEGSVIFEYPNPLASKYLGLTFVQQIHLFTGNTYWDRSDAIKAIDDLIAVETAFEEPVPEPEPELVCA